MKIHLETVARHQREGSRIQANNLSWPSQNEFINEFTALVLSALLKEVMESVDYAVLTDRTNTEHFHSSLCSFQFRSGR